MRSGGSGIPEIELVNISRGEFGGSNFDSFEKTSVFVHSGNERRTNHGLSIRIYPSILFRDREKIIDGHTSVGGFNGTLG